MQKIALGGLVLLLGLCWPAQADVIRVAAAANLQYALPEIRAAFEASHLHRLRVSYGSSGQFSAQIQQGAPFELFISADEDYVKRLTEQGLTQGAGVRYAVGRLVLFTPTGSPLSAESGLSGLKAAFQQGKIQHLAMANPAHAPYGRAARETLQAQGLWPLPSGKILLGENASQAAQFTVSGSVEAGLIPYSLAIAPPLQKRGLFFLIPAKYHQPLYQRMALLKGAGPAAQTFYTYLQGASARQTLRAYGFESP